MGAKMAMQKKMIEKFGFQTIDTTYYLLFTKTRY